MLAGKLAAGVDGRCVVVGGVSLLAAGNGLCWWGTGYEQAVGLVAGNVGARKQRDTALRSCTETVWSESLVWRGRVTEKIVWCIVLKVTVKRRQCEG